jgi:formiminotetrahydrofolate cyclodeaminase
MMADFAELPLAEVVRRVASIEPTPGAGPSLAWTCALAAALVEMVSLVSLGKEPDQPSVIEERRDRAAALQHIALSLAESDAAAYREVLAVQRRRQDPSHAQDVRKALHAAAEPLVEIVETAGELTRLAADAVAEARGGVRGEALTAAVLGAAVVHAGVSLVELNLAGARDDPRLARVRDVAQQANAARDRALTN